MHPAPALLFSYCHTPQLGVDLPMAQFLGAADGRIPTLAGIEFNSPDLYEHDGCLRARGGQVRAAWGVDEFLAGAIAPGARSARRRTSSAPASVATA